jgi:hypothetical protein
VTAQHPAGPSRRGFVTGALAAGGGLAVAGTPLLSGVASAATGRRAPTTRPAGELPPDHVVAADVRAEYLHAWEGYKRFAWGHDEVQPVSGTPVEFFVPGHPIGLSIVEAIDTLYVMEADDEVKLCLDWIRRNFDLDIDGDFHVFEFIIRVLSGLLTAYLITRDRTFLELARQAADKVMPAFTESPTGMPYTHVNFHTGAVSGNTPPIAEIGSNILEFGVLSELTGDRRYYDAAKKAYRACVARRSSLNLLASWMNVETGQWTDSTDAAPNPPDDSFYEYLWGGWEMFGDREVLGWYRMFTAAFKKHLIETYHGNVWFKNVNFQTGALVGRQQSELAAFYGEVLAHGGDIALGEAYYRSWVSVADQYPVLPSQIDYTTYAALDKSNALRPEYLNAAFDLWVQLRHPIYKSTSYAYFENMKTYNRVANGYTVINDVTTRPMVQGDYFPAYSFSENFKYLYLIFGNARRYDYRTGYLNTEGKILRGLRPSPGRF